MPAKLLIVTRHTPLPWEDGAGAYLHDLARFLAAHDFQVEVLWLAPHENLRWQKCWRLPVAFDGSIRLVMTGALRFGRYYIFPGMIWYPTKARVLHRMRRLLSAVGFPLPRRAPIPSPAALERPWMSAPSASETALVEAHVRARRPDAVIVSYAWLCPLLDRPALRSTQRACLTHDVAWQRAELAGVAAGAPPAISQADEIRWLQSARTIIAITEADAVELRSLAPGVRVLVAPKACAVPVVRPAAPPPGTQRVLFVGSGNSFNAGGLSWFLQEVWPLVRASLPGAELDVCGSVGHVVRLRPPGVIFHGSVPDLTSFYQAASVVIVPLLQASGMNIKLVDAAAAGRAIVASTVTLTGAPFLDAAIHTADTPAGFAAALHLLLTDAGANATSAGAAFAAVRAHLAPAACYGPLAAQLRSAA